MKRKFRSGTGGQYSGNTWEDWSGLSPNGRQYRNAITNETRNLSGAEYWSARKADNARMLNEALPSHFNKNGSANILAYKGDDKPKSSQKKEQPLEYKVFPQQRTYDNLEKLEKELEERLESEQIGIEEFEELNYHLQEKKERAWRNLCKAKGWREELGEPSPEEKAIEKEKERIGKAYYKELQAHNKAIEKELREAYRVGNKNAVKRTTGRSIWWERLHGIKIVAIVWVVVVTLVKMGGG